MFKKHVFLGLALLLSTAALAQSKYSAHELFHPLWNYGPVSPARSAAGVPGPGYWQNSADYKIAVSLDDVANKITGMWRLPTRTIPQINYRFCGCN